MIKINTFCARLLLAFLAANFIVLAISLFGARTVIEQEAQNTRNQDLNALRALATERYASDGVDGIRRLNDEYRRRNLSMYVFVDGRAETQRLPPPLRDFLRELNLDEESAVAVPGRDESFHSIPLSGKGIPPKTTLVVWRQPENGLPKEGFPPPGRLGDRGADRPPPGPRGGAGNQRKRGDNTGGPESVRERSGDSNFIPKLTKTSLMIYVPLLSVGIALAGWIFVRNMTSPIRSVQITINRFANGDLSARVGAHLGKRDDDMGKLAKDFDHMADRVEQLIEGRDRLLHHLSHEMRSPLARLRFAIELARDEQTDDDPNLNRVDREIDRLDYLMGEMLHLARSEQRNTANEKENIELANLLDDAIERVQIDAEKANVNVRTNRMDAANISAHPDLLDHAIENVLRNAIKYSSPGDTIEVNCVLEEKVVNVQITDQGPGIPAKELAAVLEPFYRASNSSPNSGYGLGLAIVSNAMNVHGGRVELENAKPRGLRVTLKLPYGS